MKPIIAVTAKKSHPAWVAVHVQPYLDAVADAGGEPLLLAPDNISGEHVALQILADGLLLSGGGDLHPGHYGQPVDGTEVDTIDEERDQLELTLIGSALAADMPLLAICRGIQVLNAAMGGGLVQHVDGHRGPPEDKWLQHSVNVLQGSRLAEIFDCARTVAVNSSHHQAIDDSCLAPGLRAVAHSMLGDELVEAVEAPAQRWTVAVQWHPERTSKVPTVHRRLFAALVAVAREWSQLQGGQPPEGGPDAGSLDPNPSPG